MDRAIQTTEARDIDRVAEALARCLEVWLLTVLYRPEEARLLVGTEAQVREQLQRELGDEPWPPEWTLRPVVFEDELEALRAQARTLAAEVVGLRRALAERERLAAGLPGIGPGIVTPGEVCDARR